VSVTVRELREVSRFNINFCPFQLFNSLEGGDHVTMTGHARAGMGHRS
jgi:hypothetical protein